MVIFNSYVKLPEGKGYYVVTVFQPQLKAWSMLLGVQKKDQWELFGA